MHTEKDACKLWCPMVRFTPIINSGIIIPGDRKRTEDGKIDDSCIASQCVMWQWLDDEERMEERRGFCGLARR